MDFEGRGPCPICREDGPMGRSHSRLLTLTNDICLFPPAERLEANHASRRTYLDDKGVKACDGVVVVKGHVDVELPYCGRDGATYHRSVTVPFETCIRVPDASPGDRFGADVRAKCGSYRLSDDGRTVRQTVCLDVTVRSIGCGGDGMKGHDCGNCMFGW